MNSNSRRSLIYIPLFIFFVVVIFSVSSLFSDSESSDVEAGVDKEKLVVVMNSEYCFVYFSDINYIELLDAVPIPVSSETESFIANDSGECICVWYEEGTLLFNLSTNEATEDFFDQLGSALV